MKAKFFATLTLFSALAIGGASACTTQQDIQVVPDPIAEMTLFSRETLGPNLLTASLSDLEPIPDGTIPSECTPCQNGIMICYIGGRFFTFKCAAVPRKESPATK